MQIISLTFTFLNSEKYVGTLVCPLLQDLKVSRSDVNNRHSTQISTRPRATKQGRVKCRCHSTVPTVPTQEAIPEEGGYEKKLVS